MAAINLGNVYNRVLLIEDNLDICEFYQDFFASENIQVDILHAFPAENKNIGNTYDLLVCDWLIGPQSAKDWIHKLHSLNALPIVTIIATGLLGIEDQIVGLPVKIIYKPFDLSVLKDTMINLIKNRLYPI